MQALPSAFFHQTSRASRMRAPRGWMAKSTMVVVPPKAAARVPVRKSSALIVPPKGMSRWVWQSMPPGRTYMPVASMTLAAELAGMAARTSLMSSPSMRTSAAMVWAAVTTLPLRIRVLIGVLGVGWMWIPRRDAKTQRKTQRTHFVWFWFSLRLSLRLCVSAGKRNSCAGPLGPGLGRGSGFDFGHGDAIFHRADEPAEIAADTLRFVDAGNARGGSGAAGGAQGFGFRHGRHGDGGGRGGFVDVDALVRAVPAGDVAEIAADAGIAIDARYDAVVQVEVLPLGYLGDGEAAEVFDGAEAFLVHPVGEAIDHVFHDAVAVVHGGGTDLHGATAQQNEFRRLAPTRNAADAGDGDADLRVRGDLLHEVEGDGLDGRPAISAVRREPADIGARRERIEIDTGDGVDGVDGGKGVGSARARGAGSQADVGDIRREFHDHGGARHFLDPAGDHAGVIGNLADGRAHAALAHAMGAAEIELQAIGAGVFGSLDDVAPGLALGIHHERRDDGVMGVALLDFGDLAQVGSDGAVADELDIVEAHHALAVPIQRGVARGDVDDGVADGLPHGAAPSGVEGAHDLLARVGGGAGGEPEGIGAADAGEIGREVSHGSPSRGQRVCHRPRRPPLRGRR